MSFIRHLHTILLLIAGTTIALGQQPYEDDGTQMSFSGTSVHVCSGGGVMIGLDAQYNRYVAECKRSAGQCYAALKQCNVFDDLY